MKNKRIDQRILTLKKYIKRDDLRIETVARAIGVSAATVYNWIDGRSGVSPLAEPMLDRFLREYDGRIREQRAGDVNALTS
jgi:plasmid maintenance system antidote protein VapI